MHGFLFPPFRWVRQRQPEYSFRSAGGLIQFYRKRCEMGEIMLKLTDVSKTYGEGEAAVHALKK